jgi:hypothetical protein
MKKHFVTFYSPGTFMAETTTEEIHAWDINEAIKMSKNIKERYGATPYGFVFSTRERKDNELDSKEIATSGTYFLGGKVYTLAEVKANNDPNEQILIKNMECNGWDKIITNNNSWKWTQPLKENDVVLDI